MGSNGNGHKPASNPMIERALAEQQQQAQFNAMQFNAIPGAMPYFTIEGVATMLNTETGKQQPFIKFLLAFDSGPVVALISLDHAERIAKSLADKVRLAKTGIDVVGGPSPLQV